MLVSTSAHLRLAGLAMRKQSKSVAALCAVWALAQMVCGLSSSTFSPVAGSKHSASWLNQTFAKSVNSVIVPTVEREVLTVLVCSMAMDGRMFSTVSTLGLSRSSRNWRGEARKVLTDRGWPPAGRGAEASHELA